MNWNSIVFLLGFWALCGYFIAPSLPKIRSKHEALIQVFLGGPIYWITFVAYTIYYLIFKRRE